MRILLVEDEAKTASYLQKGLTENGFQVAVARDGNEGLYLGVSEDFDLVVLDVMLPGRDGWTVLGALRKAGKSMPVLFLTRRMRSTTASGPSTRRRRLPRQALPFPSSSRESSASCDAGPSVSPTPCTSPISRWTASATGRRAPVIGSI
jgi:CheY-like chemotaxis protein